MEMDPLKIPAFMRKKSFTKKPKKENSNFYKASEATAVQTPIKPRKPQRRIVIQIPQPAPLYFDELEREPQVVKPEPAMMPVGIVTLFLDKISVAIVKLGADVSVGNQLVFTGENGPFRMKLKSMQINRENVDRASRGDEVGVKVNKKTLVGEMVYVVG